MSKTILITGATDGIGLLTAQRLAEQGHTILLHGRSSEKLATAAATLPGEAQTYRCDLGDLAAVEAMAQEILAQHQSLDVLINNAGVLKAPNTKAPSGRDLRFDVNTVAPYLLTRRLRAIIPKTGRVVNLSSAAQAPVDPAAFVAPPMLGDMEAYAQSKRAITLWSSAMADEMPDGPVVVSVNPGSLLASKMVKEGFGIAGNDLGIGADILIRAALSDEFAGASGQYFDNDAGVFAGRVGSDADAKAVVGLIEGVL